MILHRDGGGKMETSESKKTKKRKGKRRNIFLVILTWIILLFILAGTIVTIGVIVYVKGIIDDIEPIDTSKINELLDENSIILDSEGRVLETIQKDGLRTIIPYNKINPYTVNAFVSVEDKTFWEHQGFNFVRIVGAVRDAVFKGKRVQGTSTITQQLARNLYLFETRSKRDISRKIKEAYYAIELENSLTKEQIFETYLNTIYLGANSYGIEAAAHAYFSKKAQDLGLVESAMVAGIPSNPSRYVPMHTKNKIDISPDDIIIDDSDDIYTIVYNPGCEKRYQTVLYLMHENGAITDEEYDNAKNANLRSYIKPGKDDGIEITSYFTDMVLSEVIEDLMEYQSWTREQALNALYTGGFKIWSTIDFDMQKTLEAAYSRRDFTTYFDNPTYEAVKHFQKNNKLSADGIVGKGTIKKLVEMGLCNQDDFPKNTYRRGDNSEEVKLLKQILDDRGLLTFNDNFPRSTITLDAQGNIISPKTKHIMLYKKSNLINNDGKLIIDKSNFKFNDNNDLILFKTGIFHIYPIRKDRIISKVKVDIKNSYSYDENNPANTKINNHQYKVVDLYQFNGHDLLIPDKYKSLDEHGNCVVDHSLFNDFPDFFENAEDGSLLVDDKNYSIGKKGIIQPQSSMVIIDYRTGELKAIVGGRNVTGQKIYNRAMNPRQPGSSIKPIGVYLPAIDSRLYTAASVIDDVPTFLKYGAPNELWPVNWYAKVRGQSPYWGLQTLRKGIEQSQNVITVKLANELGIDTCIDYLQRLGIDTLVLSGSVNDRSLSAVALGGMTKGITPLDLTEAYGTIANKGVRCETLTYRKVTHNDGSILIENKRNKHQVVDAEAAFIVQDMMRTGVMRGVAHSAALHEGNTRIPVAGKTGTTSNKLDAWFVGYTPYYVGAVWFGNDVNIPLDQGSKIAAQFWKNVMKQIHAELPDKDFDAPPESLVKRSVDTISGKRPTSLSYQDPRGTVINEWFIPGTEPTELDDIHVTVAVCAESGKLASEYCPSTLIEERVFTKRKEPYNAAAKNNIYPRDWGYEAPSAVCDIHTGIEVQPDFGVPVNNVLYPFSSLSDGTKVVNFPFDITLKSGEVVTLPAGTKLKYGGILELPNGRIISGLDIKVMLVPEPIVIEQENTAPETTTP